MSKGSLQQIGLHNVKCSDQRSSKEEVYILTPWEFISVNQWQEFTLTILPKGVLDSLDIWKPSLKSVFNGRGMYKKLSSHLKLLF